MRWHAECKFLLYAVSIVQFNRMTQGVACISNRPPMTCLLHKITVFQLLKLLLCHIAEGSISLAAFLHLHRELHGGYHVKCQ